MVIALRVRTDRYERAAAAVTVCNAIARLRYWAALGKWHFNEMKGAFYMPDLVVSSIQSMVDAPFEFHTTYRLDPRDPRDLADKSGEPHA